jgi:DNA-binding NarL/FixJ family response regulator
MKKSELKEIIREELKRILKEQEPELSIGDRIEPEAEPSPEPDKPESEIPADQPLQNISKLEAAQKIREIKGRMFTVTFIKKSNGEKRTMNARLGVKAYLRGGVLPYDPNTKGLIPVYDIQTKDYRMINIQGIINLKTGGIEYNVV